MAQWPTGHRRRMDVLFFASPFPRINCLLPLALVTAQIFIRKNGGHPVRGPPGIWDASDGGGGPRTGPHMHILGPNYAIFGRDEDELL